MIIKASYMKIATEMICILYKYIEMSLNYNYEKMLRFLSKLQGQITEIRLFGKKLKGNYESSNLDINKTIEDLKELSQTQKNTDFKQSLNNIQYIVVERQQNLEKIQWLTNVLERWLQQNNEINKNLTDQAKKLQKKRVTKMLEQEDIVKFKSKLSNRVAEQNDSIKEIIKQMSKQRIKNACILIEKLTATMQQIKRNQKNAKNNSEQKMNAKQS